jgi:hypothetical protein
MARMCSLGFVLSGGTRDFTGSARRQRGQQVRAIIGYHLDDVIAGIEGELLLGRVNRIATPWLGYNRGRHARQAEALGHQCFS